MYMVLFRVFSTWHVHTCEFISFFIYAIYLRGELLVQGQFLGHWNWAPLLPSSHSVQSFRSRPTRGRMAEVSNGLRSSISQRPPGICGMSMAALMRVRPPLPPRRVRTTAAVVSLLQHYLYKETRRLSATQSAMRNAYDIHRCWLQNPRTWAPRMDKRWTWTCFMLTGHQAKCNN